jgi:adenine-specific DNA-methyltransferase
MRTFTHAIGNPPYIGEKQARAILSEARTAYPDLAEAYRGKADLAFLFVLRALLALEPGGRLAILTPAYWPTADGAQSLRQALRTLAGSIQLERPEGTIKSAPGVELAVLLAQKRTQTESSTNGAPIYWRQPDDLVAQLEQMANLPRRLGQPGGPLAISAGIQTGADRVTAANFSLVKGKQIGDGIFVLNDAETAMLSERATDMERSFIKPLYKSPSIGPFLLDTPHEKAGSLIYLDGTIDLARLPAIRAHLLPFRELLSQRREVSLGRMPWWRLHWPRRQESFSTPSLLIPQRASSPRAAIAPEGAYTSVDVYHAHLTPDSELDLYGWVAVLHCAPVAFWLAYRGKRKGKLFELYHTPLAAIPLPKSFSPNDASRLNTLGRTVYKFMQGIRKNCSQSKPWHLIYNECQQGNPREIKLLKEALHSLDETIADLFGVSLAVVERQLRR